MKVYATKGELAIEIIRNSLLCGKIEEEFREHIARQKGSRKAVFLL